MLASIVHILPLTTIRRERLLPVPGKVVVRRGQKVSTTDVIAEARLNLEHLLLNIARGLGVSEEKADQYLQCKAGMQVSRGDILAGPVGMAKRVVRAPRDGRVVLAGGGQILLEVNTPPYELKAGLPGTVIGLIEGRGATIEATGALVQGVWGNSRIDYGLMQILLQNPDDVLTPDRLDVSLRGSVVLAGYCGEAEVLKSADNLPLRGLIISSMEASLIPLALEMHYPIIVLEGFGKLAMNSAAYRLLTTNEQREVSLNAQPWDRFKGTRPEIVIPLPASAEPPLPPETDEFAVGQQVRIVRAPFLGSIGKITQLQPGATPLPSGIVAPAAVVQLESGENALVPLANLEVLE
jgi:hypothetical protein